MQTPVSQNLITFAFGYDQMVETQTPNCQSTWASFPTFPKSISLKKSLNTKIIQLVFKQLQCFISIYFIIVGNVELLIVENIVQEVCIWICVWVHAYMCVNWAVHEIWGRKEGRYLLKMYFLYSPVFTFKYQ